MAENETLSEFKQIAFNYQKGDFKARETAWDLYIRKQGFQKPGDKTIHALGFERNQQTLRRVLDGEAIPHDIHNTLLLALVVSDLFFGSNIFSGEEIDKTAEFRLDMLEDIRPRYSS